MMRNTVQRRVIVEELLKLHTHPTADELYRLVRERLPRISLGTVYRNLEMLSEEGVVRRINLGGRRARFDGDVAGHQHLRCRVCGRIDDLRLGAEPTECDAAALEGTGYRLVERRVEFIGVCPDCAKKMGEGG